MASLALRTASRLCGVSSNVLVHAHPRWLSAAAGEAAAAAEGAAAPQKTKFKNSFKRASNVMADVRSDAWARMQLKMEDFRPQLPAFAVGDAVEVHYASEHTEAKPVLVRGTVIAKRNKGVDTKFTILNSFDDDWYAVTYPFSSPLLRTVRVMMRQRFSQGLKRSRRAKLYALKERDPTVWFAVDHNTMESAEAQAVRAERRAAAKKNTRRSAEDKKKAAAAAKKK